MTTSKSKQQLSDLQQILKLRGIRRYLKGPERQTLDEVIEALQQQAGETVSKQNAARLLNVSRQSLDRWIKAGLLPAVRKPFTAAGHKGQQAIPREALERLALEVGDLKNSGKQKALLAQALRSLAAELDPPKKPDAKKSPGGQRRPAAKKRTAGSSAANKSKKKAPAKKAPAPKKKSATKSAE
jgi:hypothetical protein